MLKYSNKNLRKIRHNSIRSDAVYYKFYRRLKNIKRLTINSTKLHHIFLYQEKFITVGLSKYIRAIQYKMFTYKIHLDKNDYKK